MKVLTAGVAALVLFAAAAAAQTPPASTPAALPSQCPPVPAEPTLPDGAMAESAAMDNADAAYGAWSRAMQANIQCRLGEYELHTRTAQQRREEHNAAVEKLNAVTGAWRAQISEFCNRPRQRCETEQ